MAIVLGGVTLPDGLRWDDEFAWRFDTSSTTYSVNGALLVNRNTKLSGRPITLVGGVNYAWITRANVKLLQAELENYLASGITLVLHDAREFQVIPNGNDALSVKQVPLVGSEGVADPIDTTKYYIEYLKLLEV